MQKFQLIVLLVVGLILMSTVKGYEDDLQADIDNALLKILRRRRDSYPVFVKRVARSALSGIQDAMRQDPDCCIECRSWCSCCYA